MTADGSTLVTVQQVPHSNLWVATGSYKDEKQVTQAEGDGTDGLDAAGGKVAYTSIATGVESVFTANLDGSGAAQVSPPDEFCATHPPSRAMDVDVGLYLPQRTASPNIWIAKVDGSALRQLTLGNADVNTIFSPDGDFVYFQHWSEGKVHLFKVPFAGGQPVQVSDLQTENQSFSHRGDRIVVKYFDDKASQWKVRFSPRRTANSWDRLTLRLQPRDSRCLRLTTRAWCTARPTTR